MRRFRGTLSGEETRVTEWNGKQDKSGLGGNPSTNAASDGPGGAPAPDAVSVEIYDQIYNLRGTDDAYIQQIAALVDAKMRAVAAHGGTADSLRVAVLAALNIADDLTTLRARYDALASSRDRSEDSMRSRADTLSEMLDDLLEDRRAG
ncbi:MAG: cell division protein ZapA [Acidobacteriaceae bacterium]|jgi:cell division protein ZapA